MRLDWKIWFSLLLIFTIIPLIIAIQTNSWWLSALSVGVLFGFALQKGDLCGSSAMSEIILFRDRSKIFGLWVAIVSSMFFFAILNLLGVIELAPKKFIWANALVGGLIFGVGTVLAGGCISGCLYKAAGGNINSMVALLTIPFGVSSVDYGIFKSLHESLLKLSIPEPITLHSILKLPYWFLVLIFIILTIVLAFALKNKRKSNPAPKEKRNLRVFLTRPWKPWQAGIMIGFVGMLSWLSSLPTGRNYPLGVTHGVSYVYQYIIENNTELVKSKQSPNTQASNTQTQIQNSNQTQSSQPRKLNLWLMMLVIGLVLGAFLSAKMSNNFALLPKPPEQIFIAIIGGFLTGLGAGLATGCVIGNVISGWAMLSLSMFIFGFATLLGNWFATYVYLIGIGKVK